MFRKDLLDVAARERGRGLFVERNNRWRFDTHNDRLARPQAPFRLFAALGALVGVLIAHRNRHAPAEH